MADPSDSSEEFLYHAEHCPRCRAEYRRSQQMEHELQQALGITPPQGLRDRIIMQGRFDTDRRLKRRYGLFGAIAAGLLLAVGIAIRFGDLGSPSLQQQLIERIRHEPALIEEPAAQWVDPSRLEMLLHGIGGRLDGSLGQVRHAARCPIAGQDALHLVLQGSHGPVTLFLMPAQPLAAATTIQAGRLHGLLLPHQGGSIAVLGENEADLRRIDGRVRRLLHWHNEVAPSAPSPADAPSS